MTMNIITITMKIMNTIIMIMKTMTMNIITITMKIMNTIITIMKTMTMNIIISMNMTKIMSTTMIMNMLTITMTMSTDITITTITHPSRISKRWSLNSMCPIKSKRMCWLSTV